MIFITVMIGLVCRKELEALARNFLASASGSHYP